MSPSVQSTSERTIRPDMVSAHPYVILAGRRINNGRDKLNATQSIKRTIGAGSWIKASRVKVRRLPFVRSCEGMPQVDTVVISVANNQSPALSVNDLGRELIRGGAYVDVKAALLQVTLTRSRYHP